MAKIVSKKSKQKSVCTLCFSMVKDDNFKVINETIVEVLNVLLLQLNVQENEESVICNTCSTKLFAAFQFKAKCMDTEDSIFPYVNSERMAPVGLMQIYLNIKGKEHLMAILEDEQICRLCMHITTSGHIPLKEVNSDMTCKYIPEVNFNSIKEPVICRDCLDSLDIHNRVLKSYLDVEKKNRNISDNRTGITGNDKSDEDRTKKKDTFVQHKQKFKYNSRTQMYKCSMCDYKSNQKCNLQRHQLTHGDPAERTIYKCDLCNYKAVQKDSIKKHVLIHSDPSQIQKYKCDLCDYESIYKNYVKLHQRKHKDDSEVKMFKCKECDYKAKQMCNLRRHELRHKDSTEVPMYKCDGCNYKTRTKDNLINHLLIHKDLSEVRTFKCDICPFETKHRNSYASHQLKHKAPWEVQMYKCDKCDFETKRRNSLRAHQLRHK